MPLAMRILFTNNALAARAGTELYVRDVALELQRRGHDVVVYTTQSGSVAEELIEATIPVTDDLRSISVVPDVIHGHHHLDTMTALLHFPTAPALYVCHGKPWQEVPVRFPRIRRYIAVSQAGRERMVFEHGIPEERIRFLFNFVDLARFQPRDAIPARPRRAVVFNSSTGPKEGALIYSACERRGMALDVVGKLMDKVWDDPAAQLAAYDLAFAVGRSALEAMAVGLAVVLFDGRRLGPLVTATNVDALRRHNFCGRALQHPFTEERLLGELALYDAGDVRAVSRRIRECAGLAGAVDQLEVLYDEVVEEHKRDGGASDQVQEGLALRDYMFWLTRRLKTVAATERMAGEVGDAGMQLKAENEKLKAELVELKVHVRRIDRTFTWRT